MEEMLKLILNKLDSIEGRLDSMEQQDERRFTQLEVALQEINKDVKDIRHQVIVDNTYYDKKPLALEKEVFRLKDMLEN